MREKLHLVLVFLLVPTLAQAHGMHMSNGEAVFLLGILVMPFVYIFSLFFCFRLANQAETTGVTIVTKVIASMLMLINTLALIGVVSFFAYCMLYAFFNQIFYPENDSSWIDLFGFLLYALGISAVVILAWAIPYRAYSKGIKGTQSNKSDVGNLLDS